VNESLVRDLASGDFLDQQRNVVLNGGTGTGKSHLAISIPDRAFGKVSAVGFSTWSTS
jgi:DNA replication protein DnaC